MRDVLRTDDAVRSSFLRVLLHDAGIDVIVLDRHISVLQGSGAAGPRRPGVA